MANVWEMATSGHFESLWRFKKAIDSILSPIAACREKIFSKNQLRNVCYLQGNKFLESTKTLCGDNVDVGTVWFIKG